MVMSQRPWRLLMSQAPYQAIIPALASLLMLSASFLPWLADPLGGQFSAWQLPVDLGWQLRSGLFNYGLLCLCCAVLTGWIVVHTWLSIHPSTDPTRLKAAARVCYLAGLCSLIPALLFVLQYLYVDMGSVALQSQHVREAMLIRGHFSYNSSAQFIPLNLITFNPLTQAGRLVLFLDELGPGFLLSLGSVAMLLCARRLFPRTPLPYTRRQRVILTASLATVSLVILGRAPLALACNYEAEHLLDIGAYSSALTWLDRAQQLNPSLAQLGPFQLERGQAWYYLHPQQPTSNSQAYLASFYRQQNDFFSAYQELHTVWQQGPHEEWLVNEIKLTLQNISEQPHPLAGAPTARIGRETPILTWLQQILLVDPHNVYAHYMLARLQYDLHDYTSCEVQMNTVLTLSENSDIQSSAYTYLGLSKANEGKYVEAHDDFFRAQDLDPEFRNNIAREEISGLR